MARSSVACVRYLVCVMSRWLMPGSKLPRLPRAQHGRLHPCRRRQPSLRGGLLPNQDPSANASGLRDSCAGRRLGRPLRPHRLLGRSQNQRERPAHPARRHAGAGAPISPEAKRCRPRDRFAGRVAPPPLASLLPPARYWPWAAPGNFQAPALVFQEEPSHL